MKLMSITNQQADHDQVDKKNKNKLTTSTEVNHIYTCVSDRTTETKTLAYPTSLSSSDVLSLTL